MSEFGAILPYLVCIFIGGMAIGIGLTKLGLF